MKKYKIMLVLAIIIIIIGLIINGVQPKNKNNNDNNDNNTNPNKDIVLIDELYTCLIPQTCINENPELNYKLETYYHFTTFNNKVKDGNLEKKYIFNDRESYDGFEYNPNSITIKTYKTREDVNNLTRSYLYYLKFGGTTDNVKIYLDELKEKEYICEKVS